MLSLVELERVAAVLTEGLVGARVERWVEPERGRLAFSLYHRDEAGAGKHVLEIDARPDLAHLARRPRMPKAPDALPAFAAYLRAHLSRALLVSAGLRGDDRQLELRFSAREGEYVLLFSIFGRRSNLYLLDGESRILQALRPLSETRAELALGEPWVDPGSGAPRRGEDRFAGIEGLALLDAIGERYGREREARSAGGELRELRSLLGRERKSAARRLERIEAELAEAEQTSALQRQGELLKTHLADVVPGAESITLRDFESGEPVEVRLDARLSPRENLEAIFKRYQKLLRRLTKAGGQVDAAREALASLEALEGELREIEAEGEEAADGERLTALLARDDVRKLLERSRRVGGGGARRGGAESTAPPKPPVALRNLPRKLHPRRYRSIDGLEIWVGRSDEANDVLSTRLARGRDLFFHLDGAPGSHVVLRTEGREDPPAQSVLDACELAVHFSKQKKAGRADVHVVPIKNVKKPKGAKRGLVYVSGGKSIHLRREPERLERLLASRID